VLHLVIVAFGSTRIARFGARARDRLTECAASREKGCEKTAEIRAVAVETDALDELFDFVFVEASVRAVLTCLRALIARFDAARDAFLVHG
jgi:hypothetical protein